MRRNFLDCRRQYDQGNLAEARRILDAEADFPAGCALQIWARLVVERLEKVHAVPLPRLRGGGMR